MNGNNTQIGHISSEPLFEYSDNQSNVDQILSNEIVITSQPLIPFTTTNMIASPTFPIQNNVLPNNHLTQVQLARRRHQRQRQRRRERRQEQQREQQQAQRPRQQREEQRPQQSEQRESRPRYRRRSEIEWEHEYW